MKKKLALGLIFILFSLGSFIFLSKFLPQQKTVLAQACQDDDSICLAYCDKSNDSDCAKLFDDDSLGCRVGVAIKQGGDKPPLDEWNELVEYTAEIGACSAYVILSWEDVEPSPPVGEVHVYDWTRTDAELEALVSRDIWPVGRLWFTPAWASSAPREPEDGDDDNCDARLLKDRYGSSFANRYPPTEDHMDDWEAFVKAAVQRYGSSGRGWIRDWEIYHELDHHREFQVPENKRHPFCPPHPPLSCSFPSCTPSLNPYRSCCAQDLSLLASAEKRIQWFYPLLSRGARAIRSIDPEARIFIATTLAPGREENTIRLMARPEIRDLFDIIRIALHAVTDMKDVIEKVNKITQILEEQRMSDKKIWIEMSFESDSNGDFVTDEQGEAEQRRLYEEYFNDFFSLGAERVYVYRTADGIYGQSPSLSQEQWVSLGFLRATQGTGRWNYEKKPSFRTAQQRIRLLNQETQTPGGTKLKQEWLEKYQDNREEYERLVSDLNQPLPILDLSYDISDSVGISLANWYGAENGPCKDKTYCSFDDRSVYQSTSGLIEVILEGNRLYSTPFVVDRSGNPSWNVIPLETTEPYSSGPCQGGSCALDSVTYRVFPDSRIRESFITVSGKLFHRGIFPSVEQSWSVVDLESDFEKYAALGGPCYGEEGCLFDTRNFRINPQDGKEEETITMGNKIFNYKVEEKTWNSRIFSGADKTTDKYINPENAPCFNKEYCQFDSRIFLETKGVKHEELTIGNQLYQCQGLPDCSWQRFQLKSKLEGDLYPDGQINSQDLKILIENWGDPSAKPEADLNPDGLVNGIDFGRLRRLTQ